MGQYYMVVNLNKKECLNPHNFGDGMKLLEFGNSGNGTMLGLSILLANSNNRGGGDLRSENSIIGSWAGDRIVIAGDYAEYGDKCEEDESKSLFDRTLKEYKDISYDVIKALFDDDYIKKGFLSSGFFLDMCRTNKKLKKLGIDKISPSEERETNKTLRPDMIITSGGGKHEI